MVLHAVSKEGRLLLTPLMSFRMMKSHVLEGERWSVGGRKAYLSQRYCYALAQNARKVSSETVKWMSRPKTGMP